MKAPTGSRRSAKRSAARRSSPAPSDLWWLDEPIRPVWGCGHSDRLNPKLAWFTDRLPGRARTLILKAARGELRACRPMREDPACSFCGRCERYARCPAYTQWERQRAQRRISRGLAERLHEHLPPIRTLREFIALPTLTLLLQHCYGYQTHMALCRAFRENGITGPLFGTNESSLLPRYPYLPTMP